MNSDMPSRRGLAELLHAGRSRLARRANDAFLDRHPDWEARYGGAARVRGEEDALFHLEFLAGAVLFDDVSAFEDYARWTAGMLAARGIEPVFLQEHLKDVANAAAAEADDEGRWRIEAIVEAGIAAIDGGRAAVRQDDSDPFATERSLYLQAVLAGQRGAALTVAFESLVAGAAVPEVYESILQPVQYEVGRLWEQNVISVATEHMATAITQYVMAQLYARIDMPAASRGNAIVTGVQGELHQIGGNMVADMLEADGWNMRFLGTHLPHAAVLSAIEDHRPSLLGISATVLRNLPAVADLIEQTRRHFGAVAILVGGGAFRSSPEMWREIGADGFGHNIRHAVAVAHTVSSGA
ncbi:MAG: cobalamin-dependent protein [Gemmatimonadota bacterium]